MRRATEQAIIWLSEKAGMPLAAATAVHMSWPMATAHEQTKSRRMEKAAGSRLDWMARRQAS